MNDVEAAGLLVLAFAGKRIGVICAYPPASLHAVITAASTFDPRATVPAMRVIRMNGAEEIRTEAGGRLIFARPETAARRFRGVTLSHIFPERGEHVDQEDFMDHLLRGTEIVTS